MVGGRLLKVRELLNGGRASSSSVKEPMLGVQLKAKSWTGSSGMASLVMAMIPRFVSRKMHFTVSPASSWKVAVKPAPELLVSSHVIEVRSQPTGTVSVEVYVPGRRLLTTICCPSEMLPAALPLKVKVCRSPSGTVCFSTMIFPSFVSLKVQVMSSPGETAMLAPLV